MPAIALLFPGQGAQQVGMGGPLAQRCDAARDLYHRASEVLGYDLLELCQTGPAEKLNATHYSQPALLVHSLAALAELQQNKPSLMSEVVAVAGLSLGEYTAVAAAGGLQFEDAVRLVKQRGEAMQAAADMVASGMASVIGLDQQKLAEVCDSARRPGEVLQIANLLCPGNIAISGHVESLTAAEPLASQAGAMKTVRLAVAGAFHTELMAPAVGRLQQALADTQIQSTQIAVYSNVDAQPHHEATDFKSLLARQVVNPVQWEASLRAMLAQGVDLFYEIGSGRVLSGTLKRVDRKAACECFGD
jgi:[acyl-carrier-protein] S-malonyltransferase